MRVRTTLLALCFVMATPALAAPPAGGKGTDILHLTVRDALQGTGVDADAAGGVALMLRQQGNADIQKLRLDVSGLAPDATYHLLALLRGAVDPVEVLMFDTDMDGAASLKLMRGSLPDALDPLVDVLALEIRDGADQTVLQTDLGDPDLLQYLVKRALDNDGSDGDAAGWLFLKGSVGKTQLRLSAVNLDPSADYTLVIDGTPLQTFSTDDSGRLKIEGLPGGAPDALDIELVELRNAGDESVLSTMLP